MSKPLASASKRKPDGSWRPLAGDDVGVIAMAQAEYQLYCFAQSGNAYRAALMLNLIGADWQPVFVDFFKGETRTPKFRTEVSEMGEVPVLAHGTRKLSQSGVILT